MKRYTLAACAAAMLCSAPWAWAGELVVQRWGGEGSFAHAGTMKASDDGKIAFDLSAMPAGAKVARARLYAFRQPIPNNVDDALVDIELVVEGDQWGGAGGGTIGSGDPFGQINNFVHWDIDGVVDQPDRFEVTVWLDAGAPRPTCTVDLTPRKCRKFKPKEGDKFAWSAAPAGDKPGGDATADKQGLVTVQGLTVGKDKVTVKIEKK